MSLSNNCSVLLIGIFCCLLSSTEAEARYRRAGYHGHHHYYSYRHRSRSADSARRSSDRDNDSADSMQDTATPQKSQSQGLGSYPAIQYQYAVGNAVSETLSGSWPWSIPAEACVSTLVWSPAHD